MTTRTIITNVAAFIAGGAALYLLMWLLANLRWKKRGRRSADAAPREKKKSIGTMDVILIFVGVALTAFTIEMIRIFREFGTEPSTLETCVFTALGGECGVMGWIRTTKERYRDREWQREDTQPPDDFPTNNL